MFSINLFHRYFQLFLCILLCTEQKTYSNKEKGFMQTTELSFIIKPSELGGIGLFAIHDISKNTLIFNKPFKMRILKTNDIPQELQEYSFKLNEHESACPERFDRMEIGWYMNHSSTKPNIEKRIEKQYNNPIELLEALTFYATKDIKAGEEILINSEPVKQAFSA